MLGFTFFLQGFELLDQEFLLLVAHHGHHFHDHFVEVSLGHGVEVADWGDDLFDGGKEAAVDEVFLFCVIGENGLAEFSGLVFIEKEAVIDELFAEVGTVVFEVFGFEGLLKGVDDVIRGVLDFECFSFG